MRRRKETTRVLTYMGLLVGVPADAYLRGMAYEWLVIMGGFLACAFVSLVSVPFIYSLRITSAYEVS